jgi:hypothetical protein
MSCTHMIAKTLTLWQAGHHQICCCLQICGSLSRKQSNQSITLSITHTSPRQRTTPNANANADHDLVGSSTRDGHHCPSCELRLPNNTSFLFLLLAKLTIQMLGSRNPAKRNSSAGASFPSSLVVYTTQ